MKAEFNFKIEINNIINLKSLNIKDYNFKSLHIFDCPSLEMLTLTLDDINCIPNIESKNTFQKLTDFTLILEKSKILDYNKIPIFYNFLNVLQIFMKIKINIFLGLQHSFYDEYFNEILKNYNHSMDEFLYDSLDLNQLVCRSDNKNNNIFKMYLLDNSKLFTINFYDSEFKIPKTFSKLIIDSCIPDLLHRICFTNFIEDLLIENITFTEYLLECVLKIRLLKFLKIKKVNFRKNLFSRFIESFKFNILYLEIVECFIYPKEFKSIKCVKFMDCLEIVYKNLMIDFEEIMFYLFEKIDSNRDFKSLERLTISVEPFENISILMNLINIENLNRLNFDGDLKSIKKLFNENNITVRA